MLAADRTHLLPHHQSCMSHAELRPPFIPPSSAGNEIHQVIQAMLDETLVRRGSVAAFVEVCPATSPPSGNCMKHNEALCSSRSCVHIWSFHVCFLSTGARLTVAAMTHAPKVMRDAWHVASGYARHQAPLMTNGSSSGHILLPAIHTSSWPCLAQLHIEQGPELEANGTSLGIVTAIAAPATLRIRFSGDGGHAGAQLMHRRSDPHGSLLWSFALAQLPALQHALRPKKNPKDLTWQQ